MLVNDELDGVQEIIEAAGRRVAVASRSMMTHEPWGTQRLAYLLEATKLLNQSWALVRAVYGPDNTMPCVGAVPDLTTMLPFPFLHSSGLPVVFDARPSPSKAPKKKRAK